MLGSLGFVFFFCTVDCWDFFFLMKYYYFIHNWQKIRFSCYQKKKSFFCFFCYIKAKFNIFNQSTTEVILSREIEKEEIVLVGRTKYSLSLTFFALLCRLPALLEGSRTDTKRQNNSFEHNNENITWTATAKSELTQLDTFLRQLGNTGELR